MTAQNTASSQTGPASGATPSEPQSEPRTIEPGTIEIEEERLASRHTEKARNRAQAAYSAARESVGHGLEAARVKASALGSEIKDTAAAARRSAERVKTRADERYHDAKQGAIRLANEGETWVREHPTSSVFGALAIGVTAGFLASLMLLSRRRRRTEVA